MQRRLTRHLADCPACAAALTSFGDLSARIAISANAPDLNDTSSALARMHRAIDRAAAQQPTPIHVNRAGTTALRFAAPFAAIAASILIVGGVWLLDMRRSMGPGGVNAIAEIEAPDSSVAAVAPDWERIAITLRADPRSGVMADSPFAPHYADAIHWMLDGLNLTEDAQWPLPKSF